MVPSSLFVVVVAVVSILMCAGSAAVVEEEASRPSSHLQVTPGGATNHPTARAGKQNPDRDSRHATRVTKQGSVETPEEPKLKLEDPVQPIEIPTDFTERSPRPDVHKIEATIINPFRSAAIAAEVGGIIEDYNFETGDLVRQGAPVLGISKKRYDLIVQKADQNLRALKLALKRAQKDKEIKEKLLARDASSLQDLLKAETEVEIVEQRIGEGEIALKQALLDLEACQVKAPFTGYMAVRYKEPFEAVAPLEKLFVLVDSSRVYAVAYVPENLMQYFKKGAKAAFNDSYGRQFVGEVEKMEPMIDPKTAAQKVYVLLDNAEERLRIGMTGFLESMR